MIIAISLFIDQSRYCCDKILLAMLCTFYRLVISPLLVDKRQRKPKGNKKKDTRRRKTNKQTNKQTNTNNVNKTTGGKEEPNIVFMRKW